MCLLVCGKFQCSYECIGRFSVALVCGEVQCGYECEREVQCDYECVGSSSVAMRVLGGTVRLS